VAEAEANDVKTQTDLHRYAQLVAKLEISQQQYDQTVAAAKATAAVLAAARAAAVAAHQPAGWLICFCRVAARRLPIGEY